MPEEEVLGRGKRSASSSWPSNEGLPPVLAIGSIAPAVPSVPPSEEDLLADLAAKLVREEKARKAAEERAQELDRALRDADAQRDRTIGELRTTIEGLRQELLHLERARAAERTASELELERVRAEAAAEIATLRARRVPSVRSMVAIREEAQREVEGELAAVRRTADEAIAALRRLIERKESVLAEGRAELERLHPNIVRQLLEPDGDDALPMPPARAAVSDYPDLIVEDDKS